MLCQERLNYKFPLNYCLQIQMQAILLLYEVKHNYHKSHLK